MTRGHVRSARSSSPVASSDGHDTSRLMESESTTWTLSGRRTFIRGARRALIFPLTWERRGKLWIVDRSLHLSLIRRLGGFAEELHDRGPIEPRSRRDRAAIVALPSWNQGHDARHMIPRNVASFLKRNFNDRASFLKPDRGPIVVPFGSEIGADLSRI